MSLIDDRPDEDKGNSFEFSVGDKTWTVDKDKGVWTSVEIDAEKVDPSDSVSGQLPPSVKVEVVGKEKIKVTNPNGLATVKPFPVTIGDNEYIVDPVAGTAILQVPAPKIPPESETDHDIVITAPGVHDDDRVTDVPDGLTLSTGEGLLTVRDKRKTDKKGQPFVATIGGKRYLIDLVKKTATLLDDVAGGSLGDADKSAGIVGAVIGSFALLLLGWIVGVFALVPGHGRDLVLKRQLMGPGGLRGCFPDCVSAWMWKFHKATGTPMGEDGDTDNDGLTDQEEREGTRNTAFGKHPTDPFVADTDGDGVRDGEEIIRGTDPNVKN